MNTPFLSVLTLGLALACATPAMAAGDGRPVDERRPLNPDARVEVINVSGLIAVETWDRNELHLTGTLDEAVKELRITGDAASLTIEVKLPKMSGFTGATELRLKVPAGIRLDAEGVSADITVKGVQGDVVAETVSGDLRLDVGSARVRASTVSGDVNLQAPSGETTIATVSGDVTVRGARGELRAEAVSGDVDIQAGEIRRLNLETVSGDIDVGLALMADAEVSVETLSGEVRLALPALPDGELRLESFSGEIDSAWPLGPGVTRKYRREGAGKGVVRLSSFSGDLILKKK